MCDQSEKRIALGILAHVDAGKTTLSEAMLYQSGQLRRLGRVDHKDAFLDTDPLERERGITIFAKQAVFPVKGGEVTLLDTPGHVDFSAETERVLRVLDCAVLVISGTDGVQGHTLTLWRLLERYRVPVFLFVNKMDLAGTDRAGLLAELKSRLNDGCVDFGEEQDRETFLENIAERDEEALEAYLSEGELSDSRIAGMVGERKLFPCFFGSALKLEGVAALLEGLGRFCPVRAFPEEFGARVYKISRDSQGNRLTWLRVTGGELRVKGLVRGPGWEEKVDQIRLYSGTRFRGTERAAAGTVCAVTGLSRTWSGQGLGFEAAAEPPVLEAVLTYQLIPPEGADLHTVLSKLRLLEEEDPQLHVLWDERGRSIHVRLMGQVQLEVLGRLMAERFGLEVSFGPGAIVYRETIAAPVEGVGHYEPLRHYAEVHLLLEPGERGSGLVFDSICPEDALDRNWQRLILTHLEEKTHLGVLTGSPITDMRITLAAGRAHEKHTEGGDFRQATYRAVRQGLMGAESILLEPWYEFQLEIPADQVGRAMTDLQRMGGEVEPPETVGEEVLLTGAAPVAGLGEYAAQVAAYTRGRGRLSCALKGYLPCRDQERAVEAMAYDPERDLDNPADSIFCAHGAGYTVKWDQVPAAAHVDSGLRLGQEGREERERSAPGRPAPYTGSIEDDKELMAIYERTYGKVERRSFQPQKKPARTSLDGEKYAIRAREMGPEYLLVDGYNIIFAWEELKAVARENLDAARQILMDLLSNYQGFRKCEVILVFDAYRVARHAEEVVRYHNIHVVYTKEAETADTYIERATYEIGKHHRVRVATSDGLEQLIILGHGALRVSARTFQAEIEHTQGQIADILKQYSRREGSQAIRAAMEQAASKQKETGKG